MADKIIIGLHGLANKPSKDNLYNWWLKSINEGLDWIDAGVQISADQFKFFYWADSMYIKPLSEDEEWDSPFKLDSPYAPAQNRPLPYKSTFKNRMDIAFAKDVNDFLYNHGFTGILNKIAVPIVATTMKELDVYSDKTRRFFENYTASEYLTGQLYQILKESQGMSVMLIGHSMGSYICYETLKHNPDVVVDQLITIGSPLSLLGFKKGISEHQSDYPTCTWPVVPSNVRAWKNFIDWNDPVIMKSLATLREYYLTADGQEMIEDFLVDNSYTFQNAQGERVSDHHKSYGYLRCPEVAASILAFLQD